MHAYARRRRNLAIVRIMTINFSGLSNASFIFFTFSHLLDFKFSHLLYSTFHIFWILHFHILYSSVSHLLYSTFSHLLYSTFLHLYIFTFSHLLHFLNFVFFIFPFWVSFSGDKSEIAITEKVYLLISEYPH